MSVICLDYEKQFADIGYLPFIYQYDPGGRYHDYKLKPYWSNNLLVTTMDPYMIYHSTESSKQTHSEQFSVMVFDPGGLSILGAWLLQLDFNLKTCSNNIGAPKATLLKFDSHGLKLLSGSGSWP